MRSGFRRTAALLICFSSWSPVSVAQYLDVVPVSGTGSAEIRKPADRLRAVIPLSGRGENVRKAAAALKDREDAAKIQLLTLGAKKDSIWLGELSIDNGVSDTHQRMLLQLRGALPNRSGGEADDIGKEHGDVVVAVGDCSLAVIKARHDLLRQNTEQKVFVLLLCISIFLDRLILHFFTVLQ